MNIAFTIPGQPVPKGRPKFARRAAHVAAYTPAKTITYENLVKTVARLAMRSAEPTTAPVALEVTINLQIPASWSKARRASAAAGEIRATKKPDADNVLKGIKDGCNGIVWKDDAQVVDVIVRKRYSEQPSAEVTVCQVDGESAP